MGSAMLKKLACLVVFCMVVETLVTPHVANAAITSCNIVDKSLAQCIAYLKGPGEPITPPGNCCVGVRALKAAAQTTADRRVACNCMKNAAIKTKGLNSKRTGNLASRCGVRISYAFNTNINCNTVQ